MALQRGQAWLTCVTRDEAVTSALVLAESLRRTKTTRQIGAIYSEKLSKDAVLRLHKSFDVVFLLDNNLVSASEKDDELRARVFAFSLGVFDKCIFLTANTVLLENCDKLFNEEVGMYKEFSGDWEMFRFTPNLEVCDFFRLKHFRNGYRNGHGNAYVFMKGITAWLQNNGEEKRDHSKEILSEVSIVKFSLETGRLLLSKLGVLQPMLAQLIDAPDNDVALVARLIGFQDHPKLGLSEKAIIREWLNSFENTMMVRKMDASIGSTDLQAKSYKNEPIAIIGMSCRFPGANNLDEFWNLLYSGEEGICKTPAFRWIKEHTIYSRSGRERQTEAGFLKMPVDEFDSKFFGLSPKDAELLDPQARLLHEVIWESLENGGIDPHSLHGSHTGIFTGSWMNDYKDILQRSTERDFFRCYMGNSIGATAARLSFLLGLTGPSIATESGCSSAIVAVDLAVKSLRNGETNMAIAGGVNLLLHPFDGSIIEYVVSPNGRCKTFDEKADGFGRAEGCGVLILKRLSDALRDRDNIWAVIRGSAVSQEGISRSLGTPTVHCEALAMELALKDAGVQPEQVTFVETHGTGTAVGDPMEVLAIAKAYHSEARIEPLIIGSVKTNVGHTESCSGITGIIKTVLALQHELIPKHLNLNTLNPDVQLEKVPAKIPLEPIPWPKVEGQPRLAGVSSFGITGTDGHVIIEEAPDNKLPRFSIGLERPLHLIKFSAKTNEALDELLKLYGESFKKELSSNDKSYLANLAYTANTGRASFSHRAFLLASSLEDAVSALETDKVTRGEITQTSESSSKVCFLFTGQGSQYPGMGKLLYESSPVFRLYFDQCEYVLRTRYNLSIRHVLWEAEPNSKELSRTIYSQTAIFVIEYCLLKLWESWGVKPDYVLGHSLGEFCAAVAAGILSFEDALMLVVERSLLIDNLPRGSMLVVKADLPEVMKVMSKSNIILDVAAVNSNDQTVVAGDSDEIAEFSDFCKTAFIKSTILDASHAFHSHHMDPMLKKYRRIAETVQYNNNVKCQFISGMKGRVVTDISQEINADYWVHHTRDKVSFLDACKALRELECQNYIEMGPAPILSSFVMQNIEDLSIFCYPSLRRNTNDWETILTSLGKLYLNGYKVDWNAYDRPYIRKKLTNLPFYPLNRKPFWVDCHQANTVVLHPLVGHMVANATSSHIFQNDVNAKTVPYLKDHCIGHMIVYPGAGFTEMCLSAGYCVANSLTQTLDQPTRPIALENLQIEAPLEIKESKFRRMQTVISFQEAKEGEDASTSGFECKVYHHNENEEADTGSSRNWVLHASAKFLPFVSSATLMEKWNGEKISEMISTLEVNTMESFYKTVDNIGLKFGEHFRALQQYWYVTQENGLDEVVAEMKCPDEHDKYILHPLVIDTMMQAAMLSGFRTQASSTLLRVPVRIGKLTLLNSFSASVDKLEDTRLYLHSKWDDVAKCTVFLCNSKFTPIAVLEDLELIETTVKTIQSVLEQQNSKIPDSWEEIWKPIHGPLENRLSLAKLEPLFAQQDFQERIEATEKYTTPEDWEHCRKVNRLVYLYTLKALFKLGWKPEIAEKLLVEEFLEKYKILPNHSRQVNYYFRMFEEEKGLLEVRRMEENGETFWIVEGIGNGLEELIEAEVEALERELSKEEKISAVVEIYRHFSTKLADILIGEASALSILFPVESDEGFQERQKWSAQMYYNNYPGRKAVMERAREIIKTLITHTFESNKGPNGQTKKIYRVLEVGAGTGAMTEEALIEFRNVCGTQFEYYFTDISAAFFSKAEKRFEEYKGNLKFSTFNVEEPPLDQGIPVNYFDIVLASDVLHATRSLRETLRNVRHTLRAGGTLFLSETLSSTKDKGITFVFGLLDGYWLFKDLDTRQHHCCVDGDTWRKLLMGSEFEFVHVSEVHTGILGCVTGEASAMEGYEWRLGDDMLLSTQEKKKWLMFLPENETELGKIETAIRTNGGEVTVLLPEPEMEDETKLEAKMMELLSGGDVHGLIYAWGMVDKDVNDQRKFALPFMHICKQVLNLQKPPKVYLLTRGVHGITETLVGLNPNAATLFGMAKSLKNESADMLVRYIDLDHDRNLQTDEILFELAMTKEMREKERVQVAYRDSLRYEPRFNRALLAQNPAREDLQLPPCSERYGMVLPQSRMINDLLFDVIEELPVGPDEIEVAVKAYSLNFRDIITILKPTKEFEDLNNVGVDFAGVVTKVGENVAADKLQVGTRVTGLKFEKSCLPSHFVLPADRVLKIPEKMTFAEASTLPAVFATSIYCLITVGKMKKEDTVLIHTGSGGVGLSAIQLAKQVGVNIITTAGNPRKRAYLRSLGIKHVFHSRNTSYQEDIMKATNGKGVDLVLNSITGQGFKEATLAVCAQNARFVEMSKLSTWTEEEVKEMRPDVQYSLVDLTQLDEQTWRKLLEDVKKYVKEGKVTPIPFMQYDALRVRQALQYFQKAKHIGKLVVTMPEQKAVGGQWKVIINMFNGDGVYLITGGLGGIGFEVCKWMLGKGATNIMLVGRNPPKPEVAREIERLNKKGYNVMVKLADVGDEAQCKAVFDEIKATCDKPVRGIHHCAGILKDNLYANQTWGDFEATFNPKVKGTWNLHNLSKDMLLEHFVLYSSVTAMAGTPGQANHVAANCFEDAFAYYRYSLGLPATTINWGQWSQVGVAREMNLAGVLPVSVKRMLNGLEEAMRSQRLQVGLGEFESLSMWNAVCPSFKYYLDERLLKMMMKDIKGHGSQLQLKSDQFWQEMDAAEEREDKMEVVMTYMKAILRGALRMEPDEPISSDANMKDLGVDSLMLIELKNSIQSLLGSRLTVSANMLKDCNTIRELAACIVNKIYDDKDSVNKEPLSSEEFLELLKTDCVLEESIHPPTKAEGVNVIKTVMVSGCTGQLGPYMVSTLNKIAPQLEKIVCLVRTRKGECPREKLEKTLKTMNLIENVDMNKIECVGGSVQLPNFGLDEEKYNELAESVDCVFHLAVKSNHVEAYRKSEKEFGGNDIRSVNVGGTLNMLRFASNVKTKHIFYASSLLCILGEGDDKEELVDQWPEAEQMKVWAENKATGYPTSKYVSEMLLKQAVERGIPCKAFRFPWIMGDSQTGQLNYLSNHYILRFLSYLKIKAMPETAMPAIVLPVDICATLSLKIFWDERAPSETFNIAHPDPQLEVEFVKVAKEDFGVTVELVDWQSKEFVEKLYANGMPLESMKEIYEDVDKAMAVLKSKDLRAVQGYIEHPQSYFRNRKVQKFVPDFSRDIQSTMDVIRSNLKYVKSQGFLEKFGL